MEKLCRLLGERLDRSTEAGRRVLDWPGRADAFSDALPLRLTGGLHALVRRGQAPGLAACYPPCPLPGDEALWAALAPALADPDLLPWLDGAPQTNEVGRSAVLMSGLLVDRGPVWAADGAARAWRQRGPQSWARPLWLRSRRNSGRRRGVAAPAEARMDGRPAAGGASRDGSAPRVSISTRSTPAATAIGCSPMSGRTRRGASPARGGAGARGRGSARGRGRGRGGLARGAAGRAARPGGDPGRAPLDRLSIFSRGDEDPNRGGDGTSGRGGDVRGAFGLASLRA